MSNLRTAAEQALDALTNCSSEHGHRCNRCDSEVDEGGRVADALRAALAAEQPQPEANDADTDQPAVLVTLIRHALSGNTGGVRAYAALIADRMDATRPDAAKYLRRALAGDDGERVYLAAPPPAAPQPEAQPVAVVTECEACFTPDVCQLRGKCDHYSTDWLRVAPPPAAPEPSEAEFDGLEWARKFAEFDPPAPAEQPQPVAWMLRSSRGDAFHAGATPPQPIDVFPWVPLYTAPPPAAPEPSEAQIAAANEALYRVLFSIEAGAHKTVLELRRAAMLEALRAAAAARNSK